VNFLKYTSMFLDGAWLTISSSCIAFAIGLGLGIVVALLRRSPLRTVRGIGAVYVEALRNTPVLVQIFMAYFGLAALGIRLPSLVAGIAALAINGGAYLAEIIRAGIQAVPAGQLEAARSLGLSPVQAFRNVVFPQAMRTVYPPVINQFVDMILASSLLSSIAVSEITGVARIVNSITFETLSIFGFALLFYLVLTNAISFGAGLLAKALFKPPIKTTYRLGFRAARQLQTQAGGARA
jgi:polar amino acid transport system permease protein